MTACTWMFGLLRCTIKLLHSYNTLRWFMSRTGIKNSQMFIQTKTSPRMEIIAGWCFFQSVWSSGLKEVWNRRCWIWRGHQNTWTILVCWVSKESQMRTARTDRKDSSNWIVIEVINFYSYFLIELLCQTKAIMQFERPNRPSEHLNETDWQ